MASDVGSSVGEFPRGRQSRLAGSSKTSSKKGKETLEKEEKGKETMEKQETQEGLTKQVYVNMLGDGIFEIFARRREEALRAAADMRKMMMLTRHSVRYIDSHELSLSNEFQRFLEFAEQQRQREARRAKLLGLPPRSAPANMFAVRPAGSFGLPTLERLTLEEWKERRASSKLYLKMQMERIQNIRVARTAQSLKSTPPLQALDLSSAIRKKPVTPRRPTQFSAEFLHEEPPHYAVYPSRGRPATVPAETQADLYRWMEDFFREHVGNEGVDSAGGPRGTLRDSQLRDDQM